MVDGMQINNNGGNKKEKDREKQGTIKNWEGKHISLEGLFQHPVQNRIVSRTIYEWKSLGYIPWKVTLLLLIPSWKDVVLFLNEDI